MSIKKVLKIAMGVIILIVGGIYVSYEEAEAEAYGWEFIPATWKLRAVLSMGILNPDRNGNYYPLIDALDGTSSRHPIEFADILLKHGADINIATSHGWTPLMETTASNFFMGTNYLVLHHAKVDQEDEEGKTALFRVYQGALIQRNVAEEKEDAYRILYLLLAAGADPCHKDKSGATAADRLPPGLPAWDIINAACAARHSGQE